MNLIEINCQDSFLENFIAGYTILEFGENTFNETVKLPPMGFPVIKFHYGRLGDFYIQPEWSHPALLVGQITQHVHIKPENGVKFVGINLKPYGLYNLFGFEPATALNRAIPLKEIVGAKNVDIALEMIKKNLSHIERIGIIEVFLKEIAKQNNKFNSHPYDYIVDKIVKKNGLLKIQELLIEGVKLRNLQRYFQKHVGIPPKLFMQIYRHRFVLSNLLKSPAFDWKDPSLDSFYYDQSHFDRDFKKFSFENPTSYISSERLLVQQLT